MTNTHTTERTYVLAALLAALVAVGLVATALHAAEDKAPVRINPAKQTTPDDSTGSKDTQTTPAKETSPEDASRADPLADGKHFGAVTAAYVGPAELVFDGRELLVGKEARRAATADGVAADDIGDFYIRGSDRPSASIPVAADVVVTRVDCSGAGCVEGAATTYDEFTLSFDAADTAPSDARLFWITVADGHVIRIDEQYLP